MDEQKMNVTIINCFNMFIRNIKMILKDPISGPRMAVRIKIHIRDKILEYQDGGEINYMKIWCSMTPGNLKTICGFHDNDEIDKFIHHIYDNLHSHIARELHVPYIVNGMDHIAEYLKVC